MKTHQEVLSFVDTRLTSIRSKANKEQLELENLKKKGVLSMTRL